MGIEVPTTGREAVGQAHEQANRKAVWQANGWTGGQAVRQTEGQRVRMVAAVINMTQAWPTHIYVDGCIAVEDGTRW